MPVWTDFGERSLVSAEPFLHLWRLPLEARRIDERFSAYLSAAERTRAERLLSRTKRRQFVRGRGWLRLVLSFYLNDGPSSIEIINNQYGKPSLKPAGPDRVEFNLSHSGALALLAVSSGEVGVDIEELKPDLDYQEISKRFFDGQEQTALESYALTRRRRGFYRIWTRKEALLKMAGTGFSAPVCVTDNARFVRHLHVGRNYVAAVCCAEAALRIRYFQLAATGMA